MNLFAQKLVNKDFNMSIQFSCDTESDGISVFNFATTNTFPSSRKTGMKHIQMFDQKTYFSLFILTMDSQTDCYLMVCLYPKSQIKIKEHNNVRELYVQFCLPESFNYQIYLFPNQRALIGMSITNK